MLTKNWVKKKILFEGFKSDEEDGNHHHHNHQVDNQKDKKSLDQNDTNKMMSIEKDTRNEISKNSNAGFFNARNHGVL